MRHNRRRLCHNSRHWSARPQVAASWRWPCVAPGGRVHSVLIISVCAKPGGGREFDRCAGPLHLTPPRSRPSAEARSRYHPMAEPSGTLEQAIRNERSALSPVRDLADRIIDTTDYTSHQLRSFLKNAYGSPTDSSSPNVNVVSFGFKYGVPAEADLLFDVRFLPNPYFVDELRFLDGTTSEVQAFVERSELTPQLMRRLEDFLDFVIPHYAAEGKTYLSVALGCTGGKHRSVALAERLGEFLAGRGVPHSVSHRDLGRE